MGAGASAMASDLHDRLNLHIAALADLEAQLDELEARVVGLERHKQNTLLWVAEPPSHLPHPSPPPPPTSPPPPIIWGMGENLA